MENYFDHGVDVAFGSGEFRRILDPYEDDKIKIMPHVVLVADVILILKANGFIVEFTNWERSRPQVKQVFFKISSFCCFSLLRSAKVSMMTPKMRLRTIMMTTKKKSMLSLELQTDIGS